MPESWLTSRAGRTACERLRAVTRGFAAVALGAASTAAGVDADGTDDPSVVDPVLGVFGLRVVVGDVVPSEPSSPASGSMY